MTWKAPKVIEVPVGMEINMFACAARKSIASKPSARLERQFLHRAVAGVLPTASNVGLTPERAFFCQTLSVRL